MTWDSRIHAALGIRSSRRLKRAGYCVYLDDGQLRFAVCVNNERTVVRSTAVLTWPAKFEATWTPRGEVFLKVNGILVGKAEPGIIRQQPGDSMQIGADLIQPVGDYVTPNYFSGAIEELTFKYPNGT